MPFAPMARASRLGGVDRGRHRVIVNVDHMPADLTVPSFGPKMFCTKCGTIGADVRPNWPEPEQ